MSGNQKWLAAGMAGLVVLVVLGIVLLRPDNRDDPGRIAAGATATPQSSPTPAPPPEADRWTVVVADPAGGLALQREGGPELPHRQDSMARAGIEVIEVVGGGYQGETLSVEFYGGTLAEPLTAGQVDERAGGLLQTTFAVNFPNLTPVQEQVRRYDAGPLGGQVGCSSYDGGYYACGWLDEQTIGYVFVIGGTEAGTAALLLSLRADTEVRGG